MHNVALNMVHQAGQQEQFFATDTMVDQNGNYVQQQVKQETPARKLAPMQYHNSGHGGWTNKRQEPSNHPEGVYQGPSYHPQQAAIQHRMQQLSIFENQQRAKHAQQQPPQSLQPDHFQYPLGYAPTAAKYNAHRHSAAPSTNRKNYTLPTRHGSSNESNYIRKTKTLPASQKSAPPGFVRAISVDSEHKYMLFQHGARPDSLPSVSCSDSVENSIPPSENGDRPVATANELLSPDDGISLTSPTNENGGDQGLGLVGLADSFPSEPKRPMSTLDEESGSDIDPSDTHPNKFAIAIEEHTNRLCGYKRQPLRSGPQMKIMKKSGEIYSPISPGETSEVEQELVRRYYRKDLVR